MTAAQENALVGGMVGGMMAGLTVGIIILYILLVIAMWKIFTKAGEAGWKSLIPIYNSWVLYKIIGVNFWIWFLAVPLAGAIISAIAGEKSTIGALVYLVALLAADIKSSYGLAKSFGKGTGFTVGLVLLPFIFQLILGFGKDEYVGPNGEK